MESVQPSYNQILFNPLSQQPPLEFLLSVKFLQKEECCLWTSINVLCNITLYASLNFL